MNTIILMDKVLADLPNFFQGLCGGLDLHGLYSVMQGFYRGITKQLSSEKHSGLVYSVSCWPQPNGYHAHKSLCKS